jgi:hypothetical protein
MISKIYFGGGTYGCIYHIGVVKALYEAKLNNLTIYANSAGALIAACYICHIPIDEMSRVFINIATKTVAEVKTNPTTISSYQTTSHQLNVFDRIHHITPDAYKRCSGKLKLGVTLEGTGFKWIDTYSSNAQLFHMLLCSSYVPYLCNYDSQIDGIKAIDGGFGFVMSRDLPNDVLAVTLRTSSPNSSYYTYNDKNIDTNIPFLHRIFPPPQTEWEKYLNNGYKDMKYRLSKRKAKPHKPPDWFCFENMVNSPSIQFQLCYLQKRTVGMYMYNYSFIVDKYR